MKVLKLRRAKNTELFSRMNFFIFQIVKDKEKYLGKEEHLVLLEEHFLSLKDRLFWNQKRIARWTILRKLMFLIRTGNWTDIERFIRYFDCNPTQNPFNEFAYWGWLNSGGNIERYFRKVEQRTIRPRPKRFIGVGHNDSHPPPSSLTRDLPSWENVASSRQGQIATGVELFLESIAVQLFEANRSKPYIEIRL